MADEPQFFSTQSTMTIGEIAALTGAEPRAGADLGRRIKNIAPIDLAGPDDLTFLENFKFTGDLAATRAGAILITERFEPQAPGHLNVLRSREPYKAFVAVMREFYRPSLRPSSPYGGDGIAPGATVHPTARLEKGVTVDPGAVIGAEAEIGSGTIISANAVIGVKVKIGRDCTIGPNSSITHSILGDRVIIHPGCHIGQDGFGYVSGPQGQVKVPQIGRVIIEDDVEIGASTNVDRGGIRDTVVGAGTKIDNFVQVAHNVVIGRNCIIVAQSGLAGSATIEDNVVLAAGVGIAPHITVGKGAWLAARSAVIRDVPAGAHWGGFPRAKPMKAFFREMAVLERLALPSAKHIVPPNMDEPPPGGTTPE
ncbi:MAG: UDP-3-O-(3-hydroxymyristoyl)glucosamine N-acyltransferase [Xanthobacteraceae bacterium]|nr:UDP-3-O-(3-hydroxymyristoyl)glucosamine N-acyltransferase [Xanthobacteraceae bacterium]